MAECKQTEEISKLEDEESPNGIFFSPPVGQQRHQRVLDLVRKFKVKKIVDFGCNDCQFIKLVRREENVEEIFGVDIDGITLDLQVQRLQPLAADYLTLRPSPLKIQLYEGCISEYDEQLDNTGMVTMIEVIEHLLPDVLERFPKNIFGNLQPKIVVITTPNADFNVLFKKLRFGKFRHWDHKFEWTRQEFQKWCEDVASCYNYEVTYSGIGEGPERSEKLGCCSQMAVFVRNPTRNGDFLKPKTTFLVSRPYKLSAESIYPNLNDPKHVRRRVLQGIRENAAETLKLRRLNQSLLKATFIFDYLPKSQIKNVQTPKTKNNIIPEQFYDAANDKSLPTMDEESSYCLPLMPRRPRTSKFVKFLQEIYFSCPNYEIQPGQFEDAIENDKTLDTNVLYVTDVDSAMFRLKCSELFSRDGFTEDAKLRIPLPLLVDFMVNIGVEISIEQLREALKYEENFHETEGGFVLVDLERFEPEEDDSDSDYSGEDEPRNKTYSFEEFINECWDS